MGCFYSYIELSEYKNELYTDINRSNKYFFQKHHQSIKMNEVKEKINSFSTQAVRDFKTNSNFKNSSTLDSNSKSNEFNNSESFVPRLSLQKMNELFDDSDITFYQNSKENLISFSFIGNNLSNLRKKNNYEISLNSTLESTRKNTIESGNYKDYKRNKNVLRKKIIKKEILNSIDIYNL